MELYSVIFIENTIYQWHYNKYRKKNQQYRCRLKLKLHRNENMGKSIRGNRVLI